MPSNPLIIAPSILSCDLANLQAEVQSIEAEADWLQVDVMDGHFVPNLSFGAPVVKNLKTSLPLDIHLMVENPEERIEEFLEIGVGNITFHAEAIVDTVSRIALMQAIRDGGATAGIAIKPQTPVDAILDVVDEIDLVLVMSVEPGFGGQEFIASVLKKVEQLRARRADLMIQMDGGINADTTRPCREAGANNLVAGSFVFKATDRGVAINALRA